MADRNGVIRTAREAIMCKASSTVLRSDTRSENAGYSSTSDSTGRAPKSRIQNPLLNRIYHTRYQIVHKVVFGCLTALNKLDDNIDSKQSCQILSLGAGVDTSFETLYLESASIFAIDLPEIINERKGALLDLKMVNTEGNIYSSSTSSNCSTAVAGDLRDIDDVWSKLLLNKFDTECPTIVLIECVLCYIDTLSVKQLLLKLSANLTKESFIVTYDPMLPFSTHNKIAIKSNEISRNTMLSTAAVSNNKNKNTESVPFPVKSNNNGFKEMISEKFGSRKAPIRHSIQSKQDQVFFLKSCNLNYTAVFNMYQAQHYFLNSNERKVSILLEPFDEFSSLALLHRLYGISIACLDANLFEKFLNQFPAHHKIKIKNTNTNTYARETFVSPVGDSDINSSQNIAVLKNVEKFDKYGLNNATSISRDEKCGLVSVTKNEKENNDFNNFVFLSSRISDAEARVDTLLNRCVRFA